MTLNEFFDCSAYKFLCGKYNTNGVKVYSNKSIDNFLDKPIRELEINLESNPVQIIVYPNDSSGERESVQGISERLGQSHRHNMIAHSILNPKKEWDISRKIPDEIKTAQVVLKIFCNPPEPIRNILFIKENDDE